MRRLGLGVLFFAWLYGVPFLLLVGLVRRTSSPYTRTYEAARAFGATTDHLLTSALVLNAAIPAVGLLLAGLAGDRWWWQHFCYATVGVVAIYVAVAVIASHATAPLVGTVPSYPEPTPTATHCVPVSGGHSCPGG